MKKFLLSLSFVIGLVFTAAAADSKAPITYEGTITGVVCAACKEHITAALTQKLPGVVSVNVKKGKNADEQTLTIVADNTNVTKETATEALGTFAKNYQILTLAKKE
jgi:hypothetical protein